MSEGRIGLIRLANVKEISLYITRSIERGRLFLSNCLGLLPLGGKLQYLFLGSVKVHPFGNRYQ